MNPEEATLILQCRRASGQDDALPAMAEAWKVIDERPEIRAALITDAELDALIGSKLRNFATPDSLKSNILTGSRVTPRGPWWRRRPMILSIAALLTLGAASALWKPSLQPTGREIALTPAPSSLSDFREATVAKISQDRIALAKVSQNSEALQQYLASHAKGQRIPLPAGLQSFPTHGCEIFDWKGHEVTLMCFATPDSGIAHLFTINAQDLSVNLTEPLLASTSGWETMTWKQDGKIMQLIAQTTPEKLRKMVLPG